MRRRAAGRRRAEGRRTTAVALLTAVALGVGAAPAAKAYDAATTHAGLTQRAVAASTLHQVLARRLSRPLGIFDSISLHPELLPAAEGRSLMARLGTLDPAGGYRPGADGVAPAVVFVVAGSVIAKTPPERLQHLFFDPSTGAGLRDDAAVDGFLHSLRTVVDGGGLRGVATGTGFPFEGQPSLRWLEAPENDVGLPVFLAQLERAVGEADPAARSSALARAFLALGGVLTVLEDAGNPAQVRNDLRATYLGATAGSAFDRGPAFDRIVADGYGVSGVPAPRQVVRRPNLRAFFTAADGQGLADRTQRRFFSAGTLPEDGVVDRDTTSADVVREARASLTYALPTVPRLELRELGLRKYAMAKDGAGAPPRRLFAYERVPGRVRFFLDSAVHVDAARALLPEVAGYAAGLIDHLLRGEIVLSHEGDRVRAKLPVGAARIRGESLRLLAEDATGVRREIGKFSARDGAPDDVSVAIPAGARRVAAVLRGEDAAGVVVAFGELTLAPPAASR